MRVSRTRAFGALLATALLCGTSQAQPANLSISDKELVIATKEAPPFVIKQPDGTLHGISIDLWRRIADRLHLRYRLSEQPTVQALVTGTAEGSFDAAIAALTLGVDVPIQRCGLASAACRRGGGDARQSDRRTLRHGAGHRLWSTFPSLRPMATITHDTLDWYGWDEDGAGVHDVIGTRCDPYTNLLLKGTEYHHCCR
jgi:hypothetical protein